MITSKLLRAKYGVRDTDALLSYLRNNATPVCASPLEYDSDTVYKVIRANIVACTSDRQFAIHDKYFEMIKGLM